MNGRVLLVVDDARASHALSEQLTRARYPTDVCLGLRPALEKLRAGPYDAVVLDVAMEPVDALRLGTELRLRTDAPIVFLSRESGYRASGALAASGIGYPPLHDGLDLPDLTPVAREPLIRFGRFVIDLGAMRATLDDELVVLTPTEFKLLVALAERPDQVLSREELLLRVWNYTDGNSGRLVDVHIGRLRKKLRRAGVDEVQIETARGFGYRLSVAAPVAAA